MKETHSHSQGYLIETHDPQPEVRKNAETARDWEYAEEAAYLYRIASLFKDRFLRSIAFSKEQERLFCPIILILRTSDHAKSNGPDLIDRPKKAA